MKVIGKYLVFFSASLYLAFVGYVTLFSRRRMGENDYRSRMNFMPLYKFLQYGDLNHKGRINYFVDLFGNLILFIPLLGVTSLLLNRRFTLREALVFSFLFSLLIEFLQFCFNRGVLDVDDMILNTASGTAGYWLFNVVENKIRL